MNSYFIRIPMGALTLSSLYYIGYLPGLGMYAGVV